MLPLATWTCALGLVLAACGATAAQPTARRAGPTATTGSIGGLARDQTSGDPLAGASIDLSTGARTMSGDRGLYAIDDIKPGRHELVAKYAGQTVTVKNIEIDAGQVTFVDVNFTLGVVEPVAVDHSLPTKYEITRYRTKRETFIEGVVTQVESNERVAGAVVTAVRDPAIETLQTVTDDAGRYRFDDVSPGTYIVSAYYSVGGRAQIEVRRSDIAVKHGEGVMVPIWVELTKR
jgi:hypothetical protein